MGVVNLTPDSFSDGGLWLDPDRALVHGWEMVAQGATWSTSAASRQARVLCGSPARRNCGGWSRSSGVWPEAVR